MNQQNCAVGLTVVGEEEDVHLEVEQQRTRVVEEGELSLEGEGAG